VDHHQPRRKRLTARSFWQPNRADSMPQRREG